MTSGFWYLLLTVSLTICLPFETFCAAAGTTEGIVGPRPTATSQGDRYVAPTDNLTKIANALAIQTYSLSTIITIRGGLGLTKPVSVYVGYTSNNGQYAGKAEGNYNEGRGLRFILNDPEWFGTPRDAQVSVRLWEAPLDTISKTPVARFDFPELLRAKLDPLYDVAVRPIQVTRVQDCNLLTGSDVRVRWFAPDNQQHEATFRFGANKVALVPGSEWSAKEVSASWNYHVPNVGLYGFHIPSAPSSANIIPAPSGVNGLMPVQEIKFQQNEPVRHCTAQVQYIIDRKLRRYIDPSNPAAPVDLQQGVRSQ